MAFGALSSGISALNSFSKGMEVIGNNIANVNTVSFKSSRIKYSETFNQVLKQSAPSPTSGDRSNVQASQVGLGVQVEGIVGQFHQGGLSSTNQVTDLAISGEGFFLVQDPKNTTSQFATRGGDFRIDDRGFLVTSGGMRVQGLTGGSIGFEVDVGVDGSWKFVPNEDTQTGTVAPQTYGDIRLDYSKGEAEVVNARHRAGTLPRNSVMYTNNLLGVGADGVSSAWGSIPLPNTSGVIDTDEISYGPADGTPHRVGAFVFSTNENDEATGIEGVTGWHAFMEEAVSNLRTLRNVSSEGNLTGVVTDANIEQAVSSDFYYRMFGNDIDARNTEIRRTRMDDFITTLSAVDASVNLADYAFVSEINSAVNTWNDPNPNERLTLSTVSSVYEAMRDFGPDVSVDFSDLTNLGSSIKALTYWNQQNPTAILTIGDLSVPTNRDNVRVLWNGENPGAALVDDDLAAYQNLDTVRGTWNALGGEQLTFATIELVVRSGISNLNGEADTLIDWGAAATGAGISLASSLTSIDKPAVGIDGKAVQKLMVDNGDLTWDSTINPQATIDSIVGTFPGGLTEARALISSVRAEKTPELSRFAIDDQGSVVYFLNNGDSFKRGQVQLIDFNDKTALIREGQNLYSSFGAAGLKDSQNGNTDGLEIAGTNGLGSIRQGALELSNVDLTNEFANMITTQRGFQAGSRIITVSDDILQEVVNLKR